MPARQPKKVKKITADESGNTQIEPKNICVHLRPSAVQIQKQNPNLLVIAARQYRYKLLQTPVEIMITEPRKFNILEEFILRASIEFTPPPTINELASVLGLDTVFVQTTANLLESLKCLKVLPTGSIQITSQGEDFYKQGSVSLPPQPKQIYALTDFLEERITFQLDTFLEEIVDLPDLGELVPIQNNLPDISCLTMAEVQQLIQSSGLGIHVPEDGRMVTHFKMIGEPKPCWGAISIFVLFDRVENKYTIQVRQGGEILEKASMWLSTLEEQQKTSLKDLCQLTEDIINSPEEPVSKTKAKTTRTKRVNKS
jgi:hypothetical protein